MLTFFRSRMFTPAFKLFAGVSMIGFTGAVLLALTTNGNTWTFNGTFPFVHLENAVASVTGPLTIGWKGPVGNHAGYVILLSMCAVAAFLAGLLVAFRDADPEAQREVAGTETVPMTKAPTGASYWPILSAFCVGLIMVGLAVNTWYLIAGVFALAVIIGAWAFQNWAYRATGDDEVNRELYHRFVDPMRIPVVAVLIVGLIAVGFSRLLLAVPDKTTSVIAFTVAGAILFGILVAVAYGKQVNRTVISILLVLGGLLFLAAGIGGAVVGPREVEHHGSEGSTHTEGADTGGEHEGGSAPFGADAPVEGVRS